jgi:hypothetical protein
MKSTKSMLPWLWVFMLMNYLYCDVLSLFDASVLKDILAGTSSGGGVQMSPEMLFASAVLMEIPIAMILLSRLLPQGINRWANVVAAAFMALVQLASLTVGTPAAYYLFFSVIEIGGLGAIAVLALRWTTPAPNLETSVGAA